MELGSLFSAIPTNLPQEIVDELIGMYSNLPAHVKHRVEWTSEDIETSWLALFH